VSLRQKRAVVIALVLVAIGSAVLEPAFVSRGNALNMIIQSTIPGVIALGMTYVIVAGCIDLSVGSTVALCSVLLGVSLRSGLQPLAAVALALTAGVIIGTVNGLLVTRLSLAPFLATLGTMGIARGAAFLISGGEPISGVSESLRSLYVTSWSIVPLSVYLIAALLGLGTLLLAITSWGRRLYAVGSNERAATLAGVAVGRLRTMAYALAGLCAAIGGVLLTARLDSAQPLAGSLYELDAIAAVVIGGGSLSGGKGDLTGTFLGVFLILELRNAVTIVGLPTHAQPLVIGVLLVVAVALDVNQKRVANPRGY
jgi:ribose transport system permease protein